MSKTMTATTTDTAPVEPDFASMFYDTAAPLVEEAAPATPAEEPGIPVTPEPASTVSTEAVKAPESPVGTETKEKASDEKGHAAAARRLGNEVADLKRELKALAEEHRIAKAKLDGTYEEPVAPTPEEVEKRAEFKGRETASRAVAEGLFGADVVQAKIYDEQSEYKVLVQGKPWLHARVATSPQPTVEAMRVLQEQDFLAKYGTDSTQWVSKIKAELTPQILEELKQQSVTPVTGKPAPSVTGARGSGGVAREQTLEDLFYGKPAKT